jgi:DNA-binding PadR family transcriptional regulator
MKTGRPRKFSEPYLANVFFGDDEVKAIIKIYTMLAVSPGLTIFDIEKLLKGVVQDDENKNEGIKISHAAIYGLMNKSIQKGFIKISKEEPFRTGLMKKYYELTPSGLDLMLYNRWGLEPFIENISEIVREHPRLIPFFPLIIKWHLEKFPKLLFAITQDLLIENQEHLSTWTEDKIISETSKVILHILRFEPDPEDCRHQTFINAKEQIPEFLSCNEWIFIRLKEEASRQMKELNIYADHIIQMRKYYESWIKAKKLKDLIEVK